MKTFMEEYGLITVAAIIIMIFVLVATPIGNALKGGVRDTVDKFTEKMTADNENEDVPADEWVDLTERVEFNSNFRLTNQSYVEYVDGWYSSHIKVSEGETYRVTSINGYDVTSVFLKETLAADFYSIVDWYPARSGRDVNPKLSEYTFTIPSGVNYISINMCDDWISSFKLEKLGSKSLINVESDFYWDYNAMGSDIYVTFTFDDTNADIDQIAEVFEKYNVPANYATVPEKLEQTASNGQLRKDVLLEAQNNGSEILAHYGSYLTSSSSDADYKKVYVDDINTLRNYGFTINGVITGGGTDYATQDFAKCTELAKDSGILYADLTARHNATIAQYCNERNAWLGTNNTVLTSVDKYKTNGQGGWINVGSHGTAEGITIEDIEETLQYCIENGCKVVTWNYMYNNFGITK